ncbi:DUF3047 domain-containing protein [Elioraea tepida]|jgi:hypothetical protein|uniref:DUF3047 domain-containing protein n=1 Tax=Elioraea tepida TaxID=2843330 RepID=A0A975YIR2_9PROT|nr:DUF3047 domain-containing protein [Elioraea tepida]QXM23844.1 DUF3047 domain-containing protein [Elioraea tepida]
MLRLAALAAVALVALPARAALDPALAAEGWRSIPFAAPGLAIVQDGETGLRIEGSGGIAVVFQPMRVPVGPNTCLSWRWRVDRGPPPTDLTRSSGADRGLALWVGFEPDAERMGLLQRYLMGVATMSSGRRMVPGFILVYVHGGTGEEPLWHRSPLTGGIGRTMVLSPAGTAIGEWVEQEVPLAQHFRAAFGIAPTGFVTELAIAADGDDTGAAIAARIGELRFKPCAGPAQATR